MAEAMLLVSEQLDRLMIRFKSSNPEVHAAYLNSRKVVDYGTRHEKTPDGEVKTEETVK